MRNSFNISCGAGWLVIDLSAVEKALLIHSSHIFLHVVITVVLKSLNNVGITCGSTSIVYFPPMSLVGVALSLCLVTVVC